jgi:hypothetical protein
MLKSPLLYFERGHGAVGGDFVRLVSAQRFCLVQVWTVALPSTFSLLQHPES